MVPNAATPYDVLVKNENNVPKARVPSAGLPVPKTCDRTRRSDGSDEGAGSHEGEQQALLPLFGGADQIERQHQRSLHEPCDEVHGGHSERGDSQSPVTPEVGQPLHRLFQIPRFC